MRENLRYFVLFLQTYDGPSLRDMIQSINAMNILGLLFRDAGDDASRLEQFEALVTNARLPREDDKNQLRAHLQELTVLMRICEQRRIYTDLDRFLQELRHANGQGILNDYFVGIVGENNRVGIEDLIRLLQQTRMGLIRASDMTEGDRDGVRALMNAHNEVVRHNQITTPVSSSDESSEEGEELELLV